MAAITPTAGGSLNSTPAPAKQTLSSNYLSFTGGSNDWSQQYLPDLYEKEVITEVIGVGRDFEVSRFANEPFSGRTNETAIKYQFYFYSGGTLTNVENWRLDYRSEGFTTGNIFYYENNFSNSFFKVSWFFLVVLKIDFVLPY